MRPMRSALYIPGSNDRALDKARGLPVDAILFDLEDAVAPGAKAAARDTLRGALREGRYAPRLRLVRINGLDTEWGADDLAALADSDCDGILVPKVDGPGHIDAVAERLPAGRPVWAMMETPRGVANAAAIADHPRCGGLVMGKDGKWKPAKAKITSKNTIEVWSEAVPNPQEVRYAWTGYPEGANLYNRDGLPAAVFTTEDY